MLAGAWGLKKRPPGPARAQEATLLSRLVTDSAVQGPRAIAIAPFVDPVIEAQHAGLSAQLWQQTQPESYFQAGTPAPFRTSPVLHRRSRVVVRDALSQHAGLKRRAVRDVAPEHLHRNCQERMYPATTAAQLHLVPHAESHQPAFVGA